MLNSEYELYNKIVKYSMHNANSTLGENVRYFMYTYNFRGVPRIWEGGGPRNLFFRFGNLHVAKRHAAHGEAMRIARGVRGHAPPRKFFKTVQFGAF